MDQTKAIEAFAALAQDTRMSISRLLVRQEPNSLRVGDISERLDIMPSSLSGHLAILKWAGLVESTRHQREIHYSADIGAMDDVIGFCCRIAVTGNLKTAARFSLC